MEHGPLFFYVSVFVSAFSLQFLQSNSFSSASFTMC